MHTFQEGDTIFNFNPDGSGSVTILCSEIVSYGGPPRQLTVPTAHVLAFVGSFVRNQRIAQLENQDWEAVLGIE